MKKILFSALIALLATFSADAERIPRETAHEVALNHLGAGTLEAVEEPQTKSASAESAFYAFNRPGGGWVIVSADDCATPILAYSESGSLDFGNMPSNMKNYLRGVSANILKASKAGLEAAPEAKAAWAARGLIRTKASTQNLLETAAWGQGEPYNNTIRANVKDKDLATGCVATAMSIVLQYHKFPAKGTGTIPSYNTASNRYTVPAIDISNYTYDWDNMPVTAPSTTAQKAAVADLCFHCGAMVEMDYDEEGSGAYSSDIIPALTTYMSYSKSAREVYRYYYSDTEWFGLIKAEIDARRPIIYGGADGAGDDAGGHQFVIDGYNSDNCIHVNWGWSGVCNGWYAVCYLGDNSKTGVGYVFSYWDSGIFGLEPDRTGTSASEISLYLDSYDGYTGISLASGTIAKGETFTLNAGLICNENSTAYSGKIKAALLDRTGTLKEYIGAEKILSVDAMEIKNGNYYIGTEEVSGYSCTITEDIAFGDYIAFYYTDSKGGWNYLSGYNHEDSDSDYTGFCTTKMSAIPGIAYINIPSDLSAGNVYYPDLVCSTRVLSKAVVWTYDGSTVKNGYITLTSGTHTLEAVATYSDGTSETITKKFEVK